MRSATPGPHRRYRPTPRDEVLTRHFVHGAQHRLIADAAAAKRKLKLHALYVGCSDIGHGNFRPPHRQLRSSIPGQAVYRSPATKIAMDGGTHHMAAALFRWSRAWPVHSAGALNRVTAGTARRKLGSWMRGKWGLLDGSKAVLPDKARPGGRGRADDPHAAPGHAGRPRPYAGRRSRPHRRGPGAGKAGRVRHRHSRRQSQRSSRFHRWSRCWSSAACRLFRHAATASAACRSRIARPRPCRSRSRPMRLAQALEAATPRARN